MSFIALKSGVYTEEEVFVDPSEVVGIEPAYRTLTGKGTVAIKLRGGGTVKAAGEPKEIMMKLGLG